MFALYVLILTVFQDFAHALQQAGQDWLWVGSVSFGFGAQIGLYVYLRVLITAAKAVGATVATGAGTTTSTLGMVACCAHHLTDLAPLVALSGVSICPARFRFSTNGNTYSSCWVSS
jgi:O-antigen/teichoic acid export membrane protein